MKWWYRGVVARLAPMAEISFPYTPSSKWASCVQQVLDIVPPWKGDTMTATIATLRYPVPELVVPVHGPIIWARHSGRHAAGLGLMPFVRPCETAWTRWFTVVLQGTPAAPYVLRAFPGDLVPLHPEQAGQDADERVESECFWRKHAHLYGASFVVPGSESITPPAWYEG